MQAQNAVTDSRDQRQWMAEQLQERHALPVEVRHRILRNLLRTDTFESFLAQKFPQSKVSTTLRPLPWNCGHVWWTAQLLSAFDCQPLAWSSNNLAAMARHHLTKKCPQHMAPEHSVNNSNGCPTRIYPSR